MKASSKGRALLVPDRRNDPEIMDRPDNSPGALEEALRDLRLVNRWFGGQRALFRAVRPYLLDAPADAPLRVLDVGTGGADIPIALVAKANRLGRRVEVVAVERDPSSAVIAAREARSCTNVHVVRADARALPFPPAAFDIVTASLLLHHFTLPEVARLLRSFRSLARRAVLVNDLRRHLASWSLVHLYGRLTRRNPMFLHDGPLSVLRGFTEDELVEAARLAGASRIHIVRRWPYRLALTLEAAP